MLFKSQVFTQASGSIGGQTFSHNRTGMYTRARRVPVNPRSPNQEAQRMALANAVNIWTNSLTPANRESWNVYAANVPMINRLGDQVFLTGQQHFVRALSLILRTQHTVLDFQNAPTQFDLGETGQITFGGVDESNAGLLQIAGGPPWTSDTDAYIYMSFSPPQNATVNFYAGPWRGFVVVGGNDMAPITAANFNLATLNPPMSITDGQKLFVRFRVQQSDGRLSKAYIVSGIAAP